MQETWKNIVDKDTIVTPITEIVDLWFNNLYKEKIKTIRSTRELPTPVVIKDEEINNCSFLLEVKQEQESLPQTALMENKTTSISRIKMEPEWDHREIELIPRTTFMCNQDQPESKSIVQLERMGIEGNKNSILDFSEIPGPGLDRSDNFSPEEMKVLVKTENSKTIGDVRKIPEIDFDGWKIKHEEVDLIEKDWKQTEISMSTDSHENYDASKKHKCQECNYQTNRLSDLNRHFLVHKSPNEVNMVTCDKCDFKTIYRQSLKTHILRHEDPDGINFFKCDQCEYRTPAIGDLRLHLLRHKSHKEGIVFRCDKCDFKSIYKGNFKTHLLRHQNPKKLDFLKCCECGYETIHRNHFKRHLLQHTNPKEMDKFKCDKCDFKTIYKNNLKTHFFRHENHTEGNMFKCGDCEYRTLRKNDLKKHLLRLSHKIL